MATATTEAKKEVYGVDPSKVDEKVLDKYLKQYGMTTRGEPAQRVLRLAEYFKTKLKSGEVKTFAECDECGGTSPADLNECPYCGDAEPVDGLPAEVTPTPPGPPPAELRKRSEAGGEKAKAKAKAKAPAKTKAKAPAKAKAKALAKKAPVPAKAKTKAKAPAKKAPAKTKAKAEPSKAAAESTVLSPVKYTEKDLDKIVGRINAHTLGAATELYRLGLEIRTIHDEELWKLRTKDGRPAYNGFKAFVREELQVSSTNAYRLMHVTAAFSEEQLKEYGPHKLQLALQLPAELQESFLAEARDGTRDQMSERARELSESRAAGREPPPAAGKSVTVALMLGQQRVPMYKRPTAPGVVGAPTEPADSLKDDPWCSLRLTNNVTLYFRLIRSADGKLEAVIEARRGKEVV